MNRNTLCQLHTNTEFFWCASRIFKIDLRQLIPSPRKFTRILLRLRNKPNIGHPFLHIIHLLNATRTITSKTVNSTTCLHLWHRFWYFCQVIQMIEALNPSPVQIQISVLPAITLSVMYQEWTLLLLLLLVKSTPQFPVANNHYQWTLPQYINCHFWHFAHYYKAIKPWLMNYDQYLVHVSACRFRVVPHSTSVYDRCMNVALQVKATFGIIQCCYHKR